MEDVTEESVIGTVAMMHKCGVLQLQQQDDHTATAMDKVTEETKVVLCGGMENYDVLRKRVDAFLTRYIVTSTSTSGTGNNGSQEILLLPEAISWSDVVWLEEEGSDEMRGSQRRTRLAAIGRCAYQINLFYRTKVYKYQPPPLLPSLTCLHVPRPYISLFI